MVDVDAGRLLANQIPNARLAELSGVDPLPWVGDNSDEILRLIEEFLIGAASVPVLDRVLATVLVMKIVKRGHASGSRRAGTSCGLMRRSCATSSPTRQLKLLGSSGMLATFDGPSWAIHDALAIKSELLKLGIAALRGSLLCVQCAQIVVAA